MLRVEGGGVVDGVDGCDVDFDIDVDRRGEGIGLFRYLLSWLVG